MSYSNPISGPDLEVTVYASNTFPGGLKIDPADLSDDLPACSDVTDTGRLTIHVKPNSRAHKNLAILVEAARKRGDHESIHISARYPDKALVTFYGCMIVGEPDPKCSANPNRPFSFHFERSHNPMAVAA